VNWVQISLYFAESVEKFRPEVMIQLLQKLELISDILCANVTEKRQYKKENRIIESQIFVFIYYIYVINFGICICRCKFVSN
jgi:hypothetical protein